MSYCDGDDPGVRRSTDRGGAKPKGALERALIRTWRVELQVRGFSDQQAARLVMTKLLYLRRQLRR